jgi:hypothetical protein
VEKVSQKEMPMAENLGLVGRWFHTKEEQTPALQGCVRGDLGGGHYLVQYEIPGVDTPGPLEIVNINTIGDWEFFEDKKHMNEWH